VRGRGKAAVSRVSPRHRVDGTDEPPSALAGAASGWLARSIATLLELLAPTRCLACRGPGASAPRLGLCLPCRGRLRATSERVCILCGRSSATAPAAADRRCVGCRGARGSPPALARVFAPWLYAPPLDAVLRAYKFRRLGYLGPVLGATLAGELPHRLRADAGGVEVVTAVPLHWRRRWERGYDQAELLARAVAATLDRPFRPLLARCRATPRQSEESRAARLRNLRGAFVARETLAGQHVLLVDDVVTTGATLEAAARALGRAGAGEVSAAAVAQTPPPQPVAVAAEHSRVASR
jgi:ComF family protein